MVTYWRRLRPFLRIGIKLVGPFLLLYFLATVDLLLLLDTLRTSNGWLVLAAMLLALPFFALKALRWQLILLLWGVRIPLRIAVPLVCIGQYAGTVTPGQAGDAIRGWYVAQRGYPLEIGLGSVALDRLCDVLVTLCVAILGLLFYRQQSVQRPLYILAGGLLLIAILFLIAIGSRRIRTAITQQAVRLPRLIRERLDRSQLLKLQITPWQATSIALASVAALSWTYFRIYLLFLALNVSLPVAAFITFIALLSIVGPSSPGGVGTRDALLVVVLQTTLGLDHELAVTQALAVSTLILLLNVVNVAIGFGFSLHYRLDGRERAAQPRS